MKKLLILLLLVPSILIAASKDVAIVKFKASDGTSRTNFMFTSKNCVKSLSSLLSQTQLVANSITESKCITQDEIVNRMTNVPFVFVPSEQQGAILHGASREACMGFQTIFNNAGFIDAFCKFPN